MCERASIDAAYIRRERKRRADPECDECGGEGVVTVTASGVGERELACPCIERRENDDGPDDGEAWSGGFAENH